MSTATMRERVKTRTFPVVEVFGPTIQGEGPDAGSPCNFVRLGGCDYRCEWCDSMYAVEPADVRQAERLTGEEIAERVDQLPGAASLVVISGGNPALHHADQLVAELHDRDYRISVETQGTVWRPWLADVERLVISPKPPSSGMDTPHHRELFERFMFHAMSTHTGHELAIKIVIFDRADLEYAIEIVDDRYYLPFFLSVGTPQNDRLSMQQLRAEVCRRYRWLCDEVASDPRLTRARVLPQLHVLAWGAARGV